MAREPELRRHDLIENVVCSTAPSQAYRPFGSPQAGPTLTIDIETVRAYVLAGGVAGKTIAGRTWASRSPGTFMSVPSPAQGMFAVEAARDEYRVVDVQPLIAEVR